jgi:hypothetical protein
MPFLFFGIIPVKADRPDLHNAYESYKFGTIGGETYLEQRKTYVQLLVRMAENIEKQRQQSVR